MGPPPRSTTQQPLACPRLCREIEETRRSCCLGNCDEGACCQRWCEASAGDQELPRHRTRAHKGLTTQQWMRALVGACGTHAVRWRIAAGALVPWRQRAGVVTAALSGIASPVWPGKSLAGALLRASLIRSPCPAEPCLTCAAEP